MNQYLIIGIVLVLAGVFCVFCAAKDYDWFMEHRKAWLFTKLFGRNGARLIYIVLGAAIVIAGGICVLGSFSANIAS